jgi:hypothetical protein
VVCGLGFGVCVCVCVFGFGFGFGFTTVLYFVGFDCYFGRAVPCLTSLAYCKIFQKNEKDSDDDR